MNFKGFNLGANWKGALIRCWVLNRIFTVFRFNSNLHFDLISKTCLLKLKIQLRFGSLYSSLAGIFSMFVNRIKSQIRQIQTYADQLKKQKKYGDIQSSIANKEEAQTSLARDQFNIVKIILAYTEGRRLFALNSQSKTSRCFSFCIHSDLLVILNFLLFHMKSTSNLVFSITI